MLLPRVLGGGKLPMSSKIMQAMVLGAAPVLGVVGWFMGGRSSPMGSSIDMEEEKGEEKEEEDCNTSTGGGTDADPAVENASTGASSGVSATDDGGGDGGGGALGAVARTMNSPKWRLAEIPSANVHASARALALVAATIVEGGAVPESRTPTTGRSPIGNGSGSGSGSGGGSGNGNDNDSGNGSGNGNAEESQWPSGGVRLLSEEGTRLAQAGVIPMTMTGLARTRTTHFGNAGWSEYHGLKDGKGREGYVGWMGAGGSAMQWHIQQRIGFAYAMNQMELAPSNERAAALQKAVLGCAVRTQLQPQQGLNE